MSISMRNAFSISPSWISSGFPNSATHFLPSSPHKNTSSRGFRLRLRCEFTVTQVPPIPKEEFYPATVLDIEDVCAGTRCVVVEAQISRELVHREDAYSRPGQLATLRLEGEEAVMKVPVCSPPFPRDTNWSVLYKMRGDVPAGAAKAPNCTLSVKAPLRLHVCEQHLPSLYALQQGDNLQLGPFDAETGLDLRPVLFISGFPTVIMFASGRGIAVARAIIEAKEGDAGSICLGFREEVRLYYSAPDPTLIAYQGKFGEWEKRNKVKTRSSVWSRGGKEWEGLVGSFTHLWDEDDIEYDPHKTAAIVCVEESERLEIKDLLSCAEIPDKQVIYWNAGAL